MISYYELLGMIKEGKAPNKIRVHLTSEPRIYKRDDDVGEYCYYVLDNKNEENNEYEYYLTESYLESMMFDKNIEILEEEKKTPEKIKSNGKEFYCDNIDSWIDKEKTSAYCEYLMNKYNDLIDYLQSKGDE